MAEADAGTQDLEAIAAERTRIRRAHLRDPAGRPGSNGRGLHHTARFSTSSVSGKPSRSW
jgi:hypothetical protein